MKRVPIILALCFCAAAAFGQGKPPLLMRTPTINKTHIVFSYAGDLWSVPRVGGVADRLTTGVGREFAPLFSPDGQWTTGRRHKRRRCGSYSWSASASTEAAFLVRKQRRRHKNTARG